MIKALITFIILFTVDNLMVIFLPIRPVFGDYQVVPYLLLIGICLATFFDEKNHVPLLAVIFGLIYDMYATNLLGLYGVMFLVVVNVVKNKLVPVTPVNFVSIFYIVIVAIFTIEIIVYTFVTVITNQAVAIWAFVQYRLIITLIFNTVLLVLSYLPLLKILKPRPEK